MSARYTLARIQQLRSIATDPRRLIASAVPVLLLIALAFYNVDPLLRVASAAVAAGIVAVAARSYRQPREIVAAYDRSHANWDRVLDASDPKTRLTLNFPLRAGEVAYYSEMSTRFGEDDGTAREAIPGSHVDPEAIAGARARFGPAGSVYYGPRRSGKRGAVPTGVARVRPVDSGRLSITSHRFLFEGHYDTIELVLDSTTRVHGIEGSERIVLDLPDRSAAESFSVDPLLFTLAMIRRAHDPRFVMPGPPPPLGADQGLALDQDPRSQEEERLIS